MTRIPESGSGRTDGAAPAARPATALELDVDIDQALDGLRRAFPGLCIWHGAWCGSLWALLPDRLVEAKTSADLARQLHAALTPHRPRARAGAGRITRDSRPSARRPDGTWTATPAAPAQRRPHRVPDHPASGQSGTVPSRNTAIRLSAAVGQLRNLIPGSRKFRRLMLGS